MTEPTNEHEPEWLQPEPKPFKWRKLVLVTVIGVTAALIFPAMALGGLAYKDHADEKQAAAVAKAKKEKRLGEIVKCQDVMKDYINALKDLDARLDVGLNVGDMGEAAGDAAVEENRVDEADLPNEPCKRAKEHADAALKLYADSASEWDDCVWDSYCDADDLYLQGDWAKASEEVEAAENLVNGGSTIT